MASTLKATILEQLDSLARIPLDELLEKRYQRYRAIGIFATEPVGAASGR
jgi:acetyl-CoA carboxylase alpha subunit